MRVPADTITPSRFDFAAALRRPTCLQALPERRRVLWVKTDLLHPLDKGGKIRTYHMLRGLRQHAHVTYLTLADGSAAPEARTSAREYCDELLTVPLSPPEKGTLAYYA